MRYLQIHVGTLLIVILAASGCSTGSQGSSATGTSTPGASTQRTQQEFAKDAMQYRQHAAELREMARRRQLEAEVLAQKENPDMERVQGKRELAKDLLDAADQFDTKAKELQRDVPHGMAQ